MMRKLLLIFTVMFILQTCNENSNFKKEEIEEVKDVKEVKQNENNDLEYSESPVSLDGIDAVFSKDLQYGPYDENTFDIFIPKSDKPTPLVIYIFTVVILLLVIKQMHIQIHGILNGTHLT